MRVSFGEVDGDQWEEYCQKLFRLRYRDTYQQVPAQFGGDLGIEGFTSDGELFQCHCPDDELTGKNLYESQRNKMTEDIGKLKRNASKIAALGVPAIKKWCFVVPKYDSKDLILHCRAKEAEVRALGTPEISTEFAIRVMTEDDFIPEREHLVSCGIHKIQLVQDPIDPVEIQKWLTGNNAIVKRIREKTGKIVTDTTQHALLTEQVVTWFLVGKNQIEVLNNTCPTTHQKLIALKGAMETEVTVRCLAAQQSAGVLLDGILSDYALRLDREFTNVFTQALIVRLTHEAIADWMGACSLDFWR
jgi:hypothetical protein